MFEGGKTGRHKVGELSILLPNYDSEMYRLKWKDAYGGGKERVCFGKV